MSTETADRSDAIPRLVVAGGRFVGYGLAAAVGTLAVVDGVRNYLEYANGGVNQPVPYLLGVVAVLGVGYALLCGALAGAVREGTAQTEA